MISLVAPIRDKLNVDPIEHPLYSALIFYRFSKYKDLYFTLILPIEMNFRDIITIDIIEREKIGYQYDGDFLINIVEVDKYLKIIEPNSYG